MSSDFNIKPVGAPVATPFVKPAPEAAREAVQTELPAPKSVTASGAAVRSNSVANPGTEPGGSDVAPKVVIDRASAEIVYRLVDTRTNQVVNQYPEESQLRARAYLRAMDNARLESRLLSTDRQI